MPENEVNAAIRFLRERGILAEDKTQWIVKFSNGNELNIVDLMNTFAAMQISLDRERIKPNLSIEMSYEIPKGRRYMQGKNDRFYSVDQDSVNRTLINLD